VKILRLKFILKKIFSESIYAKIRFFVNSFFWRIKLKFNKKIDQQPQIKRERGFIVNGIIDNYFSYHLRPKKNKDFYLRSIPTSFNKKNGIIIQGNIGKNYEFLKETLKFYKKIFPDNTVIVSTWENEDVIKLKKLEEKNIKIIINKLPTSKSPGNTDLQIITTSSGLRLADKLGLEFCLKQRADIRIYKNDLLLYMEALIKNYPLKIKTQYKNRIISTSLNTLKYRLFSLSDFLLYGNTKDLLIYFNELSYKKSLLKYEFGSEPCFIEGTPIQAEIFLCARYLSNDLGKVTFDLDFWWQSLKDYFCIVDSNSIDFIWAKYDYDIEHRFYKSYSNQFSRCIEFSDWLILYNDCEKNWKKFMADHERYDEKYSLLKNNFSN